MCMSISQLHPALFDNIHNHIKHIVLQRNQEYLTFWDVIIIIIIRYILLQMFLFNN